MDRMQCRSCSTGSAVIIEKAMDDAIEEKPTIHRFRRAPLRAPGQPQPWPAYEPPGDTTPRYNNHTINYVDAVKKRFPCNPLITNSW